MRGCVLAGIAWVALGAAATGCHHSWVEERFGDAQRANVARMVENPEAEQAPSDPVEGLDPVTAEAVVDSYQREQERPRSEGAPASIIELSTGVGER